MCFEREKIDFIFLRHDSFQFGQRQKWPSSMIKQFICHDPEWVAGLYGRVQPAFREGAAPCHSWILLSLCIVLTCYNTQKCVRTHKSVLQHTKVCYNTQKCVRLSGARLLSSFGRKLVQRRYYVAVCRVKSAIQESEWSCQKKRGRPIYSPLFGAQSSVFLALLGRAGS